MNISSRKSPLLTHKRMIGFKDGHDATIMVITDWGNSQKMAYQFSWAGWRVSHKNLLVSVSPVLRLLKYIPPWLAF